MLEQFFGKKYIELIWWEAFFYFLLRHSHCDETCISDTCRRIVKKKYSKTRKLQWSNCKLCCFEFCLVSQCRNIRWLIAVFVHLQSWRETTKAAFTVTIKYAFSNLQTHPLLVASNNIISCLRKNKSLTYSQRKFSSSTVPNKKRIHIPVIKRAHMNSTHRLLVFMQFVHA